MKKKKELSVRGKQDASKNGSRQEAMKCESLDGTIAAVVNCIDESEDVVARLFDCQDNMRMSLRLCSIEVFNSIIDSPYVDRICNDISEARRQMEQGQMTAEAFEELKKKKKAALPTFVFNGHSTTGRRKTEDMQPSGLGMLDIDHMVGDPKEVYEDRIG